MPYNPNLYMPYQQSFTQPVQQPVQQVNYSQQNFGCGCGA